jgi:hypothetical protein
VLRAMVTPIPPGVLTSLMMSRSTSRSRSMTCGRTNQREKEKREVRRRSLQ